MMPFLKLLPEVKDLFAELVEIRRDLHMYPELLFDLPRTSSKVSEYLKNLGLEVIQNVGISGVVGVLRGPGPCILLRADMDALPVPEKNEVSYKSRNAGVSHACGHDAHTAMLLVAAKVLVKLHSRGDIQGSVKFMFQPAEEGGFGALKMMEDDAYPVLEALPRVDQAYALHVSGVHPVGHFALTEFMTAAADRFEITVFETCLERVGVNPVGVNPDGVNPVHIAAEIVTALQTIVSRNIDNNERIVLSVTSFNARIDALEEPKTCVLKGTVRSLNEEFRELTWKRIHEICKGFERTYDCRVAVVEIRGYPATINHPSSISEVLKVINDLVPSATIDTRTHMASEDFSYLLQKRPGAFLVVGAQDDLGQANHSERFNIDESSLLIGCSVLVQLIKNLLSVNY